jgi:hypothetical protein
MTAVKIFEPPRIPSLDATEWLNTASGGPAELQGLATKRTRDHATDSRRGRLVVADHTSAFDGCDLRLRSARLVIINCIRSAARAEP